MGRSKEYIPLFTSYFFILLFCYASISKILDFENFQVQIGQSPLLSAYAEFISYAVIIVELIIVVCLLLPKIRLMGLYSSSALMSAFTVYIYLILNYSDFVPCSCGGILEKLGWTEHLVFNLFCIALGVIAVCQQVIVGRKSLKKSIILLVIINFLTIGVVVLLFISSEYIIKKENNFTRRFLLHPIVNTVYFDLGLNSFYFAGSTEKKLYLGNSTTPLLCTLIDKKTGEKNMIKFSLDNQNHSFKSLQMKADNSSVFLYDGSIPIIYKGSTKTKNVKTISFEDAFFNQLEIIDSDKFALRTQSRISQQYELAVLDLTGKNKIVLKPDLLQKQIDGVFDVDGQLIKNRYNNNFAYVHTYRNQFILLDNNFKLLKRGKTIDTVNLAKLSITKLSDGRHKISIPAVRINRAATYHRNLLFVESALRGKNESLKGWNHSHVIDLYRSDKNEYAGSFYIPRKEDQPIRQILADDNYLLVLSGNFLSRYQFTEQIKKIYRSGETENL